MISSDKRGRHLPLADLGGKGIVVTTSYTDRDRMLLVPGSSFNGGDKWKVPLSWASCVVLRGVFGADLKIGPGLVEWARRAKSRVDYLMLMRDSTDLSSDDPVSAIIDEIEEK
jgi:hypothetical protein